MAQAQLAGSQLSAIIPQTTLKLVVRWVGQVVCMEEVYLDQVIWVIYKYNKSIGGVHKAHSQQPHGH